VDPCRWFQIDTLEPHSSSPREAPETVVVSSDAAGRAALYRLARRSISICITSRLAPLERLACTARVSPKECDGGDPASAVSLCPRSTFQGRERPAEHRPSVIIPGLVETFGAGHPSWCDTRRQPRRLLRWCSKPVAPARGATARDLKTARSDSGEPVLLRMAVKPMFGCPSRTTDRAPTESIGKAAADPGWIQHRADMRRGAEKRSGVAKPGRAPRANSETEMCGADFLTGSKQVGCALDRWVDV
jgi:hypothetical protein